MTEGTNLSPEKEMQEAAAGLSNLYASARRLTEPELLLKIHEDFPKPFWNRYYALAAKLHAETMTRTEQKEFLTYTDRTEARRVERLVYLIELGSR